MILIDLIEQEKDTVGDVDEVSVTVLADVGEPAEPPSGPSPLADVTNVKKRTLVRELPTITVSKLPAPAPVGLPTPLDIEPSPSPPLLETEDVELGQREE